MADARPVLVVVSLQPDTDCLVRASCDDALLTGIIRAACISELCPSSLCISSGDLRAAIC